MSFLAAVGLVALWALAMAPLAIASFHALDSNRPGASTVVVAYALLLSAGLLWQVALWLC